MAAGVRSSTVPSGLAGTSVFAASRADTQSNADHAGRRPAWRGLTDPPPKRWSLASCDGRNTLTKDRQPR